MGDMASGWRKRQIEEMTQDEIIAMAKEAGGSTDGKVWAMYSKELKHFAKLVAAHEREACAKVCDSFQARDVGMQPAECAGAIRARGNNETR